MSRLILSLNDLIYYRLFYSFYHYIYIICENRRHRLEYNLHPLATSRYLIACVCRAGKLAAGRGSVYAKQNFPVICFCRLKFIIQQARNVTKTIIFLCLFYGNECIIRRWKEKKKKRKKKEAIRLNCRL